MKIMILAAALALAAYAQIPEASGSGGGGAGGGGTAVPNAPCTITAGNTSTTCTHNGALASDYDNVLASCRYEAAAGEWADYFTYRRTVTANAVTFTLDEAVLFDIKCSVNPGRGEKGDTGADGADGADANVATTTAVLKGDNAGGAVAATAPDVVALFGSGSCSGYLKDDGSCDTPVGSGGVDVKNNAGTTVVTGATAIQFKNGAGTTWTITDEGSGTVSASPAIDTTSLLTLSGTQATQNKTLDNTNTANLKDTLFTVEDDGDSTKKLAFQLSGVTTGNTRTMTVPDASGTLALTTSNVATATALAANGANCSAGQAPLGVDASGAVEGCFTPSGATTNQNIREIVAAFDGGGSALSGTVTRCRPVSFGGTIQSATLIADQSGSITVDVLKVDYASYTGPGAASSIAAAAIPALSSAVKYQDATLTGWTTTVTAGDVYCFTASSPATVTWAQIVLKVAAN